MSAAVFVDTGGWYALQVPNDRWHTVAAKVFRELVSKNVPLITSNTVVGETFTLLLVRHGATAAWRFHDTVLRSARLQVEHVSEQVEAAAWALLRSYEDQPFSFVDGTSFALMRKRRVRRALAFDSHFAAAGFTRVGVDEKSPLTPGR